MPRELVLVPSYRRPVFLYLCLENLFAADPERRCEVRIYEDNKIGDQERFAQDLKEVEEVITYWKRGFGSSLRNILRSPTSCYGNSRNVLESYKDAYNSGADFVHLIEDDVMVSLDYFDWSREAQQKNYFATIAGHTDRAPMPCSQSGLYESKEFASLGVCWKRSNLRSVIDHAAPEYYQNSTMYLLKHFRGSSLGLKLQEQDGLIQRIAEQQFQLFAYSTPPRAAHVGFFGYHRSIDPEQMPTGTLAERIEKTRELVTDPKYFQQISFQTDLQSLNGQ